MKLGGCLIWYPYQATRKFNNDSANIKNKVDQTWVGRAESSVDAYLLSVPIL